MTGFSDEKRAYIRNELLDTGRELFARYGLKKTTISDLTDPVGIADGTFYRFFDSKERLYLEILSREQEAFADCVDDLLADASGPQEGLTAYLRLTVEEIEINPLIQQLLVEDDWERLVEEFSEDELTEQRDQELGYLLPYVQAWQEDGQLVDGDPRAITGAVNAAAFVALHREEFGDELYPAVRETLVESVAKGLITDSKTSSSVSETQTDEEQTQSTRGGRSTQWHNTRHRVTYSGSKRSEETISHSPAVKAQTSASSFTQACRSRRGSSSRPPRTEHSRGTQRFRTRSSDSIRSTIPSPTH
jgi:AcrR family transcriptional regulator